MPSCDLTSNDNIHILWHYLEAYFKYIEWGMLIKVLNIILMMPSILISNIIWRFVLGLKT